MLKNSASNIATSQDLKNATTVYSNNHDTLASATDIRSFQNLEKLDRYIGQIDTALQSLTNIATLIKETRQLISTVKNDEKSKCVKYRIHDNLKLGQVSYEKLFECDICYAPFSTLRGLNRHRAVHTKKFMCLDCEKPFTRKYALQRHQQLKSFRKKKLK